MINALKLIGAFGTACFLIGCGTPIGARRLDNEYMNSVHDSCVTYPYHRHMIFPVPSCPPIYQRTIIYSPGFFENNWNYDKPRMRVPNPTRTGQSFNNPTSPRTWRRR